MTGRVIHALAGAVLMTMPVAAQAQSVTATDPEAIAAILRAEGYKAELTKDGSGDPMIRSASSGTNFTLFFYNCTSNRNCTTLQYYAGFDVDKGSDLATINKWNSTKRFGRAYLDDEKDPRLEMDVNLDEGGVARGNFVDNLKVWLDLLDAFKTHIGWD